MIQTEAIVGVYQLAEALNELEDFQGESVEPLVSQLQDELNREILELVRCIPERQEDVLSVLKYFEQSVERNRKQLTGSRPQDKRQLADLNHFAKVLRQYTQEVLRMSGPQYWNRKEKP